MRIAIGVFQHESHSFAPMPTGWREFLQPGGFPPLQRPATLVETLRPTSVPCAGAIEVLLLQRPDRWAFAGGWVFPGGRVEPHDEADDEERTARNAAVRETA